MKKLKQKWQVGDVFTIKTSDGQLVVGQIIGQEPDLMRSVTIALFDKQYSTIKEAREHNTCDPERLFAILFVTVNHLDSGDWQIIDHQSDIKVDERCNPYEHTRRQGFVGAIVTGSGVVNDFVEAFYGLAPWDDWKDPHYLDSLLISESVKPLGRLVYKN